MSGGRRIALFGGSFNPPHVGHVLAAAWALSTADVHELWVLPTFAHAFNKQLAPFEHRLRMAALAFSTLEDVKVSDLESRMTGPSYTVLTLERLRRDHPGVSWRLMIGTDLVDQIPSWHQGERIPELAELLVVGRGGHLRGENDLAMPEVSSTDVRERLASGRPAEALVPRAVLDYIAANHLYQA